MNSIRLFLLLSLLSFEIFGQSTITDFTVSANACSGERLRIENLSQGATSYEWDFCEGDLMATPTAKRYNIANINIPYGASFVKAGNNWHAFICSAGGSSIFRIDFGAKLTNEPLSITDLGSFGGLVNIPQDIKVVESEGEYFIFVNNNSANRLVGIRLGANIENTNGIASVLLNGTAFGNGGIDAFYDGSQWVAALTNYTSLSLVNLGNQLTQGLHALSVSSASVTSDIRGIGDVKFIKQEGEWHAFIVGFDSHSIHRWDFGQDVFSTPTDHKLTSQLLSSLNPFGLAVEKDFGQWIVFAASIEGKLLRLNLGANVQNDIQAESDLGNLGGLFNTLKVDMAVSESRWVGIANDWNSNSFVLITFPQSDCGFDKQFSAEETPILYSQGSGQRVITLSSRFEDGTIEKLSRSVLASSTPAPSIDFQSASMCAQTTSQFQATSDHSLTSYTWDFGPVLGQSLFPSPSVTLPDDPFSVSLQVEAINGCKNFTKKTVSVYDPPNASFNLPSGLVCTGNDFVFTNTTLDNFDGNLTYRWLVNAEEVNSGRDLTYTFTTEGSKEITLIAAIPGCSDQEAKTIPQVFSGPVVDFDFNDACEGNEVNFHNQTTGNVSSFNWQFPDGSSASAMDAAKTFMEYGEIPVSLSATNSVGCINTKTKTVTIHSVPQPLFEFSDPPLSCTGTITPFTNTTTNADGRPVSYAWNFGDGSGTSSEKDPSYTFQEAKTYTVSLSAATEFGCVKTMEQTIAISQSPSAAFTYTPACKDVPVVFSIADSGLKSYLWETGAVYYEIAKPTHTFSTPGNQIVTLTVVGNNECVSKSSQTIAVPQPLKPAFNVWKNCINTEAVFTDVTAGTDRIVSHEWTFPSNVKASGSTANFTFTALGQKNVTLMVTTESGCKYSATKSFEVVNVPTASFSASPESGAAPLDVQFLNSSTDASTFSWRFSDTNQTSTEASPTYTFSEVGSFNVDLTATNSVGCTDVFSRVITSLVPLANVSLDVFTITENADGTVKGIVTVQNKGNTVIRNLPIHVDFSGEVGLRESIDGPIHPGAFYNFVLDYGIVKSGLDFLCARTSLPNDVAMEDNVICTDFDNETSIFRAYPNPAIGHLNVEWVSPVDENIVIALIDAMGKEVSRIGRTSAKGFNSELLDVSRLNGGLFMLVIKTPGKVESQKIFIRGN